MRNDVSRLYFLPTGHAEGPGGVMTREASKMLTRIRQRGFRLADVPAGSYHALALRSAPREGRMMLSVGANPASGRLFRLANRRLARRASR